MLTHVRSSQAVKEGKKRCKYTLSSISCRLFYSTLRTNFQTLPPFMFAAAVEVEDEEEEEEEEEEEAYDDDDEEEDDNDDED